MKELYSHKLLESFSLWFDYTLLSKGSAFQNISTPLYYAQDDRVPDGFVTYASPFKQWVADSSVPGAIVPTGISGSAGVIGRSDGAMLDFDNGRVWLPDTMGPDLATSGTYSIKDFNTYVVGSEEQKIIFEGNYQMNSRYGTMAPETGINPYGYAAPACFIMNINSDNKPFAFGGEQDTKNKMRVIIAADSIWHLDGCVSLFRDLTEVAIPLISLKDSPFNEYGDLKSGVYNYAALAQANASRYFFLEKVSAVKLTTAANSKINPNLRFGIIDFYLSDIRFPKLDL